LNIANRRHGPHQVLLIEDNPADIALMKEVFGDSQELVLNTVMDGDKALELLREMDEQGSAHLPDLILLDLSLPGTNGSEVLAQIKADRRLRRIPGVILTSSTSEDDVSRCYDLHANAYMRKASDFDGLIKLADDIRHYWLAAVTLPV
jgi:two-component system response regulator